MSKPKIMYMLTDGLVPMEDKNGKILHPELNWAVSQPNPIDTKMQIMAMIDTGPGIEVYSMSQKECARDYIPVGHVRFLREIMDHKVFAEELLHADDDEPDDSDDDDDEEESRPAAAAPQVQPSTSPESSPS